MKFERLRLVGFKSFVEPTELVIRDGLTGIVGPNGCGKSNLLEALRWVMGESSAKALRGTGAAAGGGGMEDVIFAGTARRPARNIAEVTLVLDNSGRTAPAAFNGDDRLEVARRIERGAGSDYLINARDVRQRDVQLLFADAATGAHSPALVSQGRVAAIIAARPDERRQLLEDAAGIGGLAVRRREAEIRLKAADSNLARLADLMGGAEAQAATLRRQARAAQRYRDLSTRIRAAEAAAIRQAHGEALARLEAARARALAVEAELGEAVEAETGARTAQANAAAGLPGFRQAEAEAAARLQALLTARATLLAERQAALQRRADLAAALAAAREEGDRAAARRRDAVRTRARLGEERTEATAAAQQAAEASGPAGAEVARLEAATAAAERALADAVEAHAAMLADARGVRAAAEAAEARHRRLSGERDRQVAELGRLDAGGGADAARAARDEAEAKASALAAAAEAAGEALVAAEAARRSAEDSRARAAAALSQARAEVQGLEAEAEALRRLQVRPDARAARLALEAAPGFEAALAAALGEDAAAAAGPAPAGAPPARRWLGAAPRDGDPPLPPGVAPLAPQVRAPPELGRRMAQVGVVDAPPDAALLAALSPGQRLVTRDGWLWRWDGFVAPPGGAAGAVAEAMRQSNRLAELERLLEDPRARMLAADAEVERQKAALVAAQAAERAAIAARGEAARARDQATARLEGLRNTLAAAEARRTAVQAGIARLGAECEGAAAELAAARAAVAALPDSGAAAERVADARRGAERARAELARARADLAGLVRGRAEAEARAQAIGREIDGWDARAREDAAAAEALAGRIAALEAEHEKLLGAPEAIGARLALLEADVATAEDARARAGEAVVGAELALAGLDQAARARAAHVADLREARAAARSQEEAAAERLDAVVAEAQERFGGLPAPPAGADAESAEAAAAPGLLEALRAERDRLGAVNLVAEAELRTLEETLARQAAEKAELETAIARLRGSIGALNREGRARLLEAFRQVDAHFRDLFLTLFGGGQAELALVDSDDPLEAGLEIRAQPPGKRLQSLSLLSGGEQALTAIALIFALFRTRPAPICVLDEVDAPLDDANVERFCRLLAHMAETTDTRFLVVTHNMISMAAMHRLYGVTMGEPGVSRLVSVALAEAEALVAA
jgi:chromosome segregation protein